MERGVCMTLFVKQSDSMFVFTVGPRCTMLQANMLTLQASSVARIVYSGCKFSFSKIPKPFTQTKRINGQWKGPSAGGCGNNKDSYKHNPIYQVTLERPGPLLVELRGSRQYSVGFEMVTVSMVGDPGPAAVQKRSSGDYRCGFCYMEADHVPAGLYNVIPTTFLAKQEGPFFLDFGSTSPVKVSQLQ